MSGAPVDNPPAVIERAPAQTEAEFRAWAREEFKHVRAQLGHIGATLDLLLKMAQADEDRAEHG